VQRTRDFSSRRFRFIPNSANTGGGGHQPGPDAGNPLRLVEHRPIFRFNEETRPVDAYDGETTNMAGYGMVDIALSSRARLVGRRPGRELRPAGQHVRSLRPLPRQGVRPIKNTDIYPGANFIYTSSPTRICA
jgi:hypothetical protein